MQNDKKNNSAFETLLDSISITNNYDRCIGEHKKKIEELENEKEQNVRKLKIIAAKYFCKERIMEIHKKSVDLLTCNDFCEEDFIHIFSDISMITLGHIVFLADRQQEIERFERSFNNESQQFENNPSSMIGTIADILLKGGANDD